MHGLPFTSTILERVTSGCVDTTGIICTTDVFLPNRGCWVKLYPDTASPLRIMSPPLPASRKVKNSWGDTWGQDGYILLERADAEEDAGGECGLLIEAVYPILESSSPPSPPGGAAAAAEDDRSTTRFPLPNDISLENEDWAELENDDWIWDLVDAADIAPRPSGFRSSATASDCGGGTTDVVFQDGESGRKGNIYIFFTCRPCWCAMFLSRV